MQIKIKVNCIFSAIKLPNKNKGAMKHIGCDGIAG